MCIGKTEKETYTCYNNSPSRSIHIFQGNILSQLIQISDQISKVCWLQIMNIENFAYIASKIFDIQIIPAKTNPLALDLKGLLRMHHCKAAFKECLLFFLLTQPQSPRRPTSIGSLMAAQCVILATLLLIFHYYNLFFL